MNDYNRKWLENQIEKAKDASFVTLDYRLMKILIEQDEEIKSLRKQLESLDDWVMGREE